MPKGDENPREYYVGDWRGQPTQEAEIIRLTQELAMSGWQASCELRRFDDTGKLTNPRLQQKWTRGDESEWRDVPLVWEPKDFD